MNCKPGDLAVMLTSRSGANAGRLCRVIEYYGIVEYEQHGALDVWNVECLSNAFLEEEKKWVGAGFLGVFPDKFLRPLPADAEPETIVRELEAQS